MTVPSATATAIAPPVGGSGKPLTLEELFPGLDFSTAEAAVRTRDAKLQTLPPVSVRFGKNTAANIQAQNALSIQLAARGVSWTPRTLGIIDGDTEAAVGKLQTFAKAENPSKKISVNGKIGQQTWTILMGAPPEYWAPPGFTMLNPASLVGLSTEDWNDLLNFEGGQFDLTQFDGMLKDYTSAIGGTRVDAGVVRAQLEHLARKLGEMTSEDEGHEGDGVHVTGTMHHQHLPDGQSAGFDFAGTPKAQAQYFVMAQEIARRAGYQLDELFYDPMGKVKNGVYSPNGIGGHRNHVHTGFSGRLLIPV